MSYSTAYLRELLWNTQQSSAEELITIRPSQGFHGTKPEQNPRDITDALRKWGQSTGCPRDHKSRLTTCNAKGGSVARHTPSSLRTFIIKVQGEVRMMPLFGADKVSTDPPPQPASLVSLRQTKARSITYLVSSPGHLRGLDLVRQEASAPLLCPWAPLTSGKRIAIAWLWLWSTVPCAHTSSKDNRTQENNSHNTTQASLGGIGRAKHQVAGHEPYLHCVKPSLFILNLAHFPKAFSPRVYVV